MLLPLLGTHSVGRLEEAFAECEEFFPVLAAPAIRRLIERIHEMDEIDREIRRIVKEDEALRRLMTIPGVGELTEMPVHTFAPPMESFRDGRDSAAWVGLSPRDSSTSAPTGRTAWFGSGGRLVGLTGRHRRNTDLAIAIAVLHGRNPCIPAI